MANKVGKRIELPNNFQERSTSLERELQSNSLSIEGLHCLLQLYKLAESYYATNNLCLKNEYHSKYLYVLSLPKSNQLMKAKLNRYQIAMIK